MYSSVEVLEHDMHICISMCSSHVLSPYVEALGKTKAMWWEFIPPCFEISGIISKPYLLDKRNQISADE